MNKRIKGYGVLRFIGLAVVVAILAGMAPNRAFAAQERSGGSYESPSFGFVINWDESVWEGVEAEQAEGVQLTSETSFGIIQAVDYDGDTADCVADSVTSVAGGEDVYDFDTAPRRMDRPATDRSADGELFTYYNAEDTEIAMYIECRETGVEAIMLQAVLLTVVDSYEDAVVEWEQVLGDIEVADRGSSNSRDDDDDRGSSNSRGDDDDTRGSDAPEAGLDGDVYYAPEFGFSVTFDEGDWAARELEAEDEMGTGIEVSSEMSIGWITVGDELQSDFEDCAATYGEGVAEYEAISRFREASSKYDMPETDRDAVGALYTFTQDVDGDAIKMVGYFECRELDDDLAAMIFLATGQDVYEDELPLWNDLLGGIEIDAAAANDDDLGSSNSRDEEEDEPTRDDDTRRDDEEEEDEPVLNADASFVGANFGFSVALNESIWAYEDLSDNGNDFLSLESEFAIGTIIGFAGTYDPASCLEIMISLKAGEDVTSFDVAPESMERPKTSRDATGELFIYSYEGQDGPVEVVMWVECRALAGGEANLALALSTVPAIYEDALPEFEAVLAGIETSQEA